MTDRQIAQQAMIDHYDAARAELGKTGAFGKDLDRKARKLALRMAGIRLPEGASIAWATPDDWGRGPLGYRAPGRPVGTGLPPEQQTRPYSVRLTEARISKLQALGSAWLAKQIDAAISGP